jgi:hypothetical protein
MTATEFEFDLVFALPEGAGDEAAILDALFEAGCDDAVPGLGQSGLLGLSFSRAGEDAETVIRGAIADALRALPDGARLREVRPDLVSLADVAARLGVSRQALQKRRLPPPSLGGLYRARELGQALMASKGRVVEGMDQARGWLAAAEGAQRVNAQMGLAEASGSATD